MTNKQQLADKIWNKCLELDAKFADKWEYYCYWGQPDSPFDYSCENGDTMHLLESDLMGTYERARWEVETTREEKLAAWLFEEELTEAELEELEKEEAQLK